MRVSLPLAPSFSPGGGISGGGRAALRTRLSLAVSDLYSRLRSLWSRVRPGWLTHLLRLLISATARIYSLPVIGPLTRVTVAILLFVLRMARRALLALYRLADPAAQLHLFGKHLLLLLTLYAAHILWRFCFQHFAVRAARALRRLALPAEHRARAAALQAAMDDAPSYTEWRSAAAALDDLDGLRAWKENPSSELYDYRRVSLHLLRLRELYDARDIRGLMWFTRASVARNLVGINSRALYTPLRAGTKALIEDYIGEVVRALQLICVHPTPTVSLAEKVAFFTETRHAYGRSALLLSGGASLGLYHTGVLKALASNQLLPRVIAGASVGSIMCAMVGTRTDAELVDLFSGEPGSINLSFFPSNTSSVARKVRRLVYEGRLMDIEILARAVRSNVPNLTFQEAFDKTGRISNIVVSPAQRSGNRERFRILNHLTAPHVLIWSAAMASCAIPLVYQSVELLAKDDQGNTVPYLPADENVRWEDGSFSVDLPMTRLAELFNVNHFIVSQVNPHIVPFLTFLPETDPAGAAPRRAPWDFLCNPLARTLRYLSQHLTHLVLGLVDLGLFPVHGYVAALLGQTYTGDITILPSELSPQDYLGLLHNPTYAALRRQMRASELDTWRLLPRIEAACAVEFTLDECVSRLRGVQILEAYERRARASTAASATSSMAGAGAGGLGGAESVTATGVSVRERRFQLPSALTAASATAAVGPGLGLQRPVSAAVIEAESAAAEADEAVAAAGGYPYGPEASALDSSAGGLLPLVPPLVVPALGQASRSVAGAGAGAGAGEAAQQRRYSLGQRPTAMPLRRVSGSLRTLAEERSRRRGSLPSLSAAAGAGSGAGDQPQSAAGAAAGSATAAASGATTGGMAADAGSVVGSRAMHRVRSYVVDIHPASAARGGLHSGSASGSASGAGAGTGTELDHAGGDNAEGEAVCAQGSPLAGIVDDYYSEKGSHSADSLSQILDADLAGAGSVAAAPGPAPSAASAAVTVGSAPGLTRRLSSAQIAFLDGTPSRSRAGGGLAAATDARHQHGHARPGQDDEQNSSDVLAQLWESYSGVGGSASATGDSRNSASGDSDGGAVVGVSADRGMSSYGDDAAMDGPGDDDDEAMSVVMQRTTDDTAADMDAAMLIPVAAALATPTRPAMPRSHFTDVPNTSAIALSFAFPPPSGVLLPGGGGPAPGYVAHPPVSVGPPPAGVPAFSHAPARTHADFAATAPAPAPAPAPAATPARVTEVDNALAEALFPNLPRHLPTPSPVSDATGAAAEASAPPRPESAMRTSQSHPSRVGALHAGHAAGKESADGADAARHVSEPNASAAGPSSAAPKGGASSTDGRPVTAHARSVPLTAAAAAAAAAAEEDGDSSDEDSNARGDTAQASPSSDAVEQSPLPASALSSSLRLPAPAPAPAVTIVSPRGGAAAPAATAAAATAGAGAGAGAGALPLPRFRATMPRQLSSQQLASVARAASPRGSSRSIAKGDLEGELPQGAHLPLGEGSPGPRSPAPLSPMASRGPLSPGPASGTPRMVRASASARALLGLALEDHESRSAEQDWRRKRGGNGRK